MSTDNAMEPSDSQEMGDITRVLHQYRNQPELLQEKLYPLVYAEMRRIARLRMPSRQRDAVLQPSVLISEAYLRLSQIEPYWKNRGHFYGMASKIMRNIVVDYIRRTDTIGRGGGVPDEVIDDFVPGRSVPLDMILDVHSSLERLEAVDPVAVKMIELTFFAGLTVEEATEEAGLKPTTAKAKLRFAKAWMAGDLKAPGSKK